MTKRILALFVSALMGGCYYPEETCYGPRPYGGRFTATTSEKSNDIKIVPTLASQTVEAENGDSELSISKITNWKIAYYFEHMDLKDVPTGVDETVSYEFKDLPIRLKDRTLSVQDVATGESHDLAAYSYDAEIEDAYIGWAPSNDAALLYKLSDSDEWTLHRFDPAGDPLGAKKSLPDGHYQWLQGPNHLAYTTSYDDGSGTIAEYLDVSGAVAKKIYVKFENLSYDPYLNRYTYYLVQKGSSILLGSFESSTYYSNSSPGISPDGNELFLGDGNATGGVLINLSTRSARVVSEGSPPFTPIPYHSAPLDTSFDGKLTASISNETQAWNAELKLTVKSREKEQVGDEEADRITYQYEWNIQNGDSFAKESGTVDVGMTPGGCYYND